MKDNKIFHWKKIMVRTFWGFIIAVLLIILPFVIWLVQDILFDSDIGSIEDTWDIEITGKAECTYETHEGFLEGILYYVFTYEDSIAFEGLDLTEGTNGVSIPSVEDYLDTLAVPQEHRPNFNQITKSAAIYGSAHDSRNEFYLLLDEKNRIFYTIESIM